MVLGLGLGALAIGLTLRPAPPRQPPEPIRFADVSASTGIDYRGITFGAAWRDVNGDGFVDISYSRHFYGLDFRQLRPGEPTPPHASLLLNQNGKHFQEQGQAAFGAIPGDWHRPGWADIDNDGDPDVLFARGGASGLANRKGAKHNKLFVRQLDNLLFLNRGSLHFDERGREMGLAQPRQRGRRPSWMDLNLDGRLDVILTQNNPIAANKLLFQQHPDGSFAACPPISGVVPNVKILGAQLFHGFADQARYLMLGTKQPLFRQSQDPSACAFMAQPFLETDPKKQPPAKDWVLADLDGDLSLDLFLVEPCIKPEFLNNADGFRWHLPQATVGEVHFRAPQGGEISFRPPTGPDSWLKGGEDTEIRLGADKIPARHHMLKFDAAHQEFQGQPTHQQAPGIYLYRQPDTDIWTVGVAKTTKRRATVIVTDARNFELISAPEYDSRCPSPSHSAFLVQGQQGWRYADFPWPGDLSKRSCHTVTAGDFDSDGDLDLYLGCEAGLDQYANLLLQQIQGEFLTDFSGVANTAGTGKIDSVSTGDYDNDGRLDLLVTAGQGPTRDIDNAVRLLRNETATGNWIRLRLRGTHSNRDAYGAQVYLTSNGRTQTRLLDGGGRPTAADEPVLHFGIGTATRIDRMIVRWPDASLEAFDPAGINRSVDIVEGSGQAIQHPVLVSASTTPPSAKPVRVLLLMPPEYRAEAIQWTLDGEPLPNFVAMRDLRLTNGRHEILAHDTSSPPQWHSQLLLTVE